MKKIRCKKSKNTQAQSTSFYTDNAFIARITVNAKYTHAFQRTFQIMNFNDNYLMFL